MEINSWKTTLLLSFATIMCLLMLGISALS